MVLTEDPISVPEFFGEKSAPECGASVFFVGTVRSRQNGKTVKKLYYECHKSMAEKQIESIIEKIRKSYGVERIRLLHRIGWLEVGDTAIVIEVNSCHRREAFAACQAVLEEVKRKVPIWKKEVYADGTAEWVLSTPQEEAVL